MKEKVLSEYVLTDDDVIAITRFLDFGGNACRITRDIVNFEAGLLNLGDFTPHAYGSGDTIQEAINDAAGGRFKTNYEIVTEDMVSKALAWLEKNQIKLIKR